MQFTENFYGHLIPVLPLPLSVSKITRLLTFEQSFRYRIEKFIFDASDSLDAMPHKAYLPQAYAPLPQTRFRWVSSQLKTLHQELGFLIGDLDEYANPQ